jgi:hypothetical protein
MKLTLNGTIEQPSKAPLIVECNKMSLLSDFTNGSKVSMGERGNTRLPVAALKTIVCYEYID